MTNTGGVKSKGRKWLPALIAALVLVALAAWWFNRSQDRNELSDAMASDPVSRQDSSGTGGQPGVPAGTNAAALAGGDRGNASAIENADAARGQPVPGADPLSDGVAGRGPGAAPAPSPATTPAPQPAPAGQ